MLLLFSPAAASGPTYTLAANSASYSLAGQSAGLSFNRVLAADSGSYALAGQNAGLAFNRVMQADSASYALTGQAATLTYTPVATDTQGGGDGGRPKRVYIRRKGKILLFDTAAQADAYMEAEEEAQEAIVKAKSRGAKKRIAARVLKVVEPAQVVDIEPLEKLVKAYSVPVDLQSMLKLDDYQQVMDVRAMIQRIQDNEDDELLLLLA